MMVMASNNGGLEVGVLAGTYPGLVGHLYSPGGQRGPYRGVPYALDNGAYVAYKHSREWPEAAWYRLLEWAQRAKYAPLWALVPDVVADRDATLARWDRFAPLVERMGFRPAFALQDGMTFGDVPTPDCMLFLGGGTAWKEAAIGPWCERFPARVHVARVTERDRLLACHRAGAVSVDGNGWFRKSNKPGCRVQWDDMIQFFEDFAQGRLAA